jgi:hypothetical protein
MGNNVLSKLLIWEGEIYYIICQNTFVSDIGENELSTTAMHLVIDSFSPSWKCK